MEPHPPPPPPPPPLPPPPPPPMAPLGFGPLHLSGFVALGAALAFAAAILARVLLATVNLDGGPPRHFVRVLGVLDAFKIFSLAVLAIGLGRTALDRRNPPLVVATALGGMVAIVIDAL
ncbi:MAG: hypothetical protein KBG48_33695 [Kofleriaceae bacterium]|nr:hypothetical protein [Kofleriaceae bacterium]